jgi:hypothetical protein
MRIAAGMLIAGIACLLAGSPALAEDTLSPFTTDGCSDFPDGTPQHRELWLKCCIAHDQKYWMGGTYQERLKADLELRECVQSVGEPAIAALMLAGVRVGGSPMVAHAVPLGLRLALHARLPRADAGRTGAGPQAVGTGRKITRGASPQCG